MKKALIVASVASMIDQFNMSNIALLQELGFEVSVACNFLEGSTCSDERIAKLRARLDDMGVPNYHLDLSRRVTDVSRNFGAYKTLKKLIDGEEGGFDLIHCHSPIGGLICRMAGRAARKRGTVMMYTAHGFHFYHGAPKKNWLLYYPIEKFCSRFTDVLLTINGEDNEYAEKKMKAGRNVYIPGVGIDLSRFDGIVIDRAQKRAEIGVPTDAFLLISVGELNVNKNHEVILRAMSRIGDGQIHYAMVGKGDLEAHHRALISELGLEANVHMLGFREDVAELYASADVCVFPSIREGLGVAAIEGLASGLPLIAADNRGTRDYAIEGKGAFVCKPDDIDGFAEAIKSAKASPDLARMGEFNREYVRKYDIGQVMEIMRGLYGGIGNE
jgi:glycosyltransferase involved in cell wall biosynthesis